jgi:hypothetical protein
MLKVAWAMADAVQRQRFLEDYLAEATNRIKPHIRFPLCSDAKGAPLDPKHLEQVAGELARIFRDINAPPLQHPVFTNSSSPLAGFSIKVSAYDSLARALLDPNLRPVNCAVSLAPYNIDDKWRDAWRFISIVGAENDPKLGNTSNLAFEKLADLSIDRTIGFVLKESEKPDSKKADISVQGQWAPIRLLFTPQAIRTNAAWFIRLPTGKDGNAAGEISLRIEFPNALPDIKNWCGPL